MAKDKGTGGTGVAAKAAAAAVTAPAERPAAGVAEKPQQVVPQQLQVDETKIHATYANFVRVTGTPEELIVDFGLNKQVAGNAADPIHLTQRLVLNFFTAKRLAVALSMAVQRHEAAFGNLETDVQKRLQPGLRPAPAPVKA
jgi:hypothetical protein